MVSSNKARLRRRVPRPLWHALQSARHPRLLLADVKDRARGARTATPIPPRTLQALAGDGDFFEIGQQWVSLLEDLVDLCSDDDVLDIGCGVGRMALPLAAVLTTGTYVGFDVIPSVVKWCQRRMTPAFSNFTFVLADIQNDLYNPHGQIQALDYRFPAPDGSVDVATASSVFTHLPSAEVRHYLDEVARVLRPGGRGLFSMFLLNDAARRAIAEGRSTFTFTAQRDGQFVEDKDDPDVAVAFEESELAELLAASGLRIARAPAYGSWTGQPGGNFQDLLAIERAGPPTMPHP